eukprot:453224_1
MLDFRTRYFIQFVVYQIMTICQLSLGITSIIQFRRLEKKKKQTLTPLIKYSYAFTILLGCLVFLVLEWFGIADFIYSFPSYYSRYCVVGVVLGNVVLMTYIYSLYMFYFFRLYSTFKLTQFALSKKLFYALIIMNSILYICLIIFVFKYKTVSTEEAKFTWIPKKNNYIICTGEFSIGLDDHIRIVLQIIIIVGNIFYGALFFLKLNQLIKHFDSTTSSPRRNQYSLSAVQLSLIKIFKLMKKQTTLVFVSTISTLILWSIANILMYTNDDVFLQILIYFDIFINCLCLWMMFQWNDKYYFTCCKLCIIVNEKFCFGIKQSPTFKKIRKLSTIKVNSLQQSKSKNESTYDTSENDEGTAFVFDSKKCIDSEIDEETEYAFGSEHKKGYTIVGSLTHQTAQL